MNRYTISAYTLPSIDQTASGSFSGVGDSSQYQMNVVNTPSMLNYMPNLPGMWSQSNIVNEQDEEVVNEVSFGPSKQHFQFMYEDERCLQLWRQYRDIAGQWMSHRFTLWEWDTGQPAPHPKYDAEIDASFDGVLTKKLIAPNLSRLASCPEFQQYTYTKCVLVKKKISDISALRSYRYLQYLDVSSNKITTLRPLGNLPFLKILDASHNMLTTILDFNAPFYLTSVNLSHNKFRVMKDLSDFWSITDLDLSHNYIRIISGLKTLRYLTTLNLSSNKIENIEHLSGLRIQFLYLQNNLIKIEEYDDKIDLDTLKDLRTINLGYNMISSLKMFETVENLEVLDIVNNNVCKLLDIYYLRNLKYLNRINLTGNPVTYMKRYLEVCVSHIKNLLVLDGENINSDFWLDKLSSTAADINQEADHSRLKLLVLEQFNSPNIWSWIVPYDSPPLAVIVLVGLQGTGRGGLGKRFCKMNKNVVVGVPYTTKPKRENDVEGQYFYYVSEETFMTMLKNGEFITYEEYLGSCYGIGPIEQLKINVVCLIKILRGAPAPKDSNLKMLFPRYLENAHSEFRKAENGILMFYTNLTTALSLKRKILNTVFVLAVPSSQKAHLEILCSLYVAEYIDKSTWKIYDYRLEDIQEASPCSTKEGNKIVEEAHHVIDDVVEDVLRRSEERDIESLNISNFPPELSPFRDDIDSISMKSEQLQLWWISNKDENGFSLSMMIHPVHLSITDCSKSSSMSVNSKTLEHLQHSAQLKRYVNVTTHSFLRHGDLKLESSSTSKNEEGKVVRLTIPSAGKNEYSLCLKKKKEGKELIKSEEKESMEISSTRRSSEGTSIDKRFKSLFDEQLRERQELIELHLEMPGLFRELIFVDQEQDAMVKLKTLVRDITRYNQTTKRHFISFENDLAFNRVTRDRVKTCFYDLNKEMSITAKQIDEYRFHEFPGCQGMGEVVCRNPLCEKWL